MTATAKIEPSAQRELTITRVLDAPRAAVFKAWTDPKQLARWWGPRHFTNPLCEVDARSGGAIRIHMRGPDGTEYPMVGTFREVAEPARIAFVAVAQDQASHPLLESVTTAAFAEQGGKTKLTLHAKGVGLVPDASRYLDGMEMGWNQSLDRLAEILAAT